MIALPSDVCIIWQEFLEILNILFDQSQEDLWKMFQEGGKADYLTWFLRVMTAGTAFICYYNINCQAMMVFANNICSLFEEKC